MNDTGYDISHLLERDTLPLEPYVKPVSCAAAAPPAPVIDNVVVTQEAVAPDFENAAAAHEEMIRQYLAFAADLESGEVGP